MSDWSDVAVFLLFLLGVSLWIDRDARKVAVHALGRSGEGGPERARGRSGAIRRRASSDVPADTTAPPVARRPGPDAPKSELSKRAEARAHLQRVMKW